MRLSSLFTIIINTSIRVIKASNPITSIIVINNIVRLCLCNRRFAARLRKPRLSWPPHIPPSPPPFLSHSVFPPPLSLARSLARAFSLALSLSLFSISLVSVSVSISISSATPPPPFSHEPFHPYPRVVCSRHCPGGPGLDVRETRVGLAFFRQAGGPTDRYSGVRKDGRTEGRTD